MVSEPSSDQRRTDLSAILSLIAALQSSRTARDRNGLLFIEGVRNFVACVDQRWPVHTLVYSERLLTVPLARKLVRQLKRNNVPFLRVSPEQFRAISQAERASGVAAILYQQTRKLTTVLPHSQPCWLALSHVRSPGNLGTLIRSATATGVRGIILLGDQIDPFNPAVVRASMGAIFEQKLLRASLSDLEVWARQSQIAIIGASPDGTALYNAIRYPQPMVLLLGEERKGLTAEQRAICDQCVRIPMLANTDSLNLGVAGSLLLYEIMQPV